MRNYDALKKIYSINIKSVLEIGVASGSTTELILNDNEIISNLQKLVGIDPHIPYVEKSSAEWAVIAQNKYLEIIDNSIVEYYNDFSINVLSKFVYQNNSFDCIIIDGLHHAKNVLEDMTLSFNILNNNGYIIIDDYLWYPSIKPSVRKLEDSCKDFESTPIHRRCKDVIDMFALAYKPYIEIISGFSDIKVIKKIGDQNNKFPI